MRKTVVAILLLATSGCASQTAVTKSDSLRPAAQPAAGSPASPSTSPAPEGVAVPTCSGPEVQPDWWTPNCGDAGYQFEPVWDSWSAKSATAHGRVTTRLTIGTLWSVHVVFDRPRAVAGYGGRPLFSRLVVRYDSGHGPDGVASETMDLTGVWKDAIFIANDPVPDCTTDPDGNSDCAPGIPEPDVTPTG